MCFCAFSHGNTHSCYRMPRAEPNSADPLPFIFVCCGGVSAFVPNTYAVPLRLSYPRPVGDNANPISYLPLAHFLSYHLVEAGEHPRHPGGSSLLEGCDLETCSSVRLDYHLFSETVPMPDFAKELQVGTGVLHYSAVLSGVNPGASLSSFVVGSVFCRIWAYRSSAPASVCVSTRCSPPPSRRKSVKGLVKSLHS